MDVIFAMVVLFAALLLVPLAIVAAVIEEASKPRDHPRCTTTEDF